MNRIDFGDCRETMRRWAADGVKVQTCVTSPPYFGLRDYGHEGQIGLEPTPEAYIAAMVEVFRCVRDVLADDGTLWLNIGDSYAGGGGFSPNSPSNQAGSKQTTHKGSIRGTIKPQGEVKAKDLIGIPWMLAFALRADGWYLRQDIIWHKPNPMPESVRDRCTKAHEYIFLLSKSQRYYFDAEAIAEPATDPEYRTVGKIRPTAEGNPGFEIRGGLHNQQGGRLTRNKRSVWMVTTKPYKGAHFATFPPDLIEPCILAGSRQGDVVLDPFMGSGTTAQVAVQHGRQYLGCELNPAYEAMQQERLTGAQVNLL
jgi:DNA modification methylase